MTLFALFVLCVVGVTGCQTAFLLWLCWPCLKPMVSYAQDMLVRKTHCAWCWGDVGLTRWYPECWSSTICRHHEADILARSAVRRAARQARSAQKIAIQACIETSDV